MTDHATPGRGHDRRPAPVDPGPEQQPAPTAGGVGQTVPVPRAAVVRRRREPAAAQPPNAIIRRFGDPVDGALGQRIPETFSELMQDQETLQRAIKDFPGTLANAYTTVGFEHEFATMDYEPLKGVTHLEIAKSTATEHELPISTLPFILETDAQDELEFVTPPFVVETHGSRVPDAKVVRAMKTVVQQRLQELSTGTVGNLIDKLGVNPGITFAVTDATVERSNIGPETTGDHHTGSKPIAAADIRKIPLGKSTKHREKPVSSQVNFATNAQGYLRSRNGGTTIPQDPNDATFTAFRTFELALLATLQNRIVVALGTAATKQLRQFVKILSRALSTELAVPVINQAREWQEGAFEERSGLEQRNQARNRFGMGKNPTKNAKAEHSAIRGMASHVKDVGDTWIKDNPIDVGIGILAATDWAALAAVDPAALLADIRKLQQPKLPKHVKINFSAVRERCASAVDEVISRAQHFQRLDPHFAVTKRVAPQGDRPDFLGHNNDVIGARQDTHIHGGKVQIPGLEERVHVVETRGDDGPLSTLDRLNLMRILDNNTDGEITDAALAEEIGLTDEVQAIHRWRTERAFKTFDRLLRVGQAKTLAITTTATRMRMNADEVRKFVQQRDDQRAKEAAKKTTTGK